MDDPKMRVWWMPQAGVDAVFYVPVETVEEAKKVMDLLAAYDCFQYNHEIKPDYCNIGGLQVFDKEEQCWNDWKFEGDDEYFDDVDEYCEQKSQQKEKLDAFAKSLYDQVTFE